MQKLVEETQTLLGIQLSAFQVKALSIYEEELISWNKKFNLTAIRTPEGIRTKHFLDSFSCILAFRDRLAGHMIDVGTGAGFPGIPLKILLPNLRLTLVDSIGKKVTFCSHIVETLKLENVNVFQARAEELGRDPEHRERYDFAVARAVANLSTLSEYLLPLVKVGGIVLAQKGESGPAEAHKAEKGIKLLGGHISQLKNLHLPGVAEERFLISIDKVAATPPKYPRNVGLPSKNPL